MVIFGKRHFLDDDDDNAWFNDTASLGLN